MNELTVTCHQCGSADMLRLDRKEYKCRHCGAITVISDNDAERLEQLLKRVLAGQAFQPQPASPRRRLAAAISVFVAFVAIIAAGAILSSRNKYTPGVGHGAEDYFAATSVPADKLVMSSLHWESDGSQGGSYSGVLYNHSGYAVSPPHYNLNLFRNGIKDEENSSSISLVSTLEPGEYEPVVFRCDHGHAGDRYEVEQPERIMRNTFEVAPVSLSQIVLVHAQGSESYALVGTVRNTLTRPIRGSGELMIYNKDGQVVASGGGSFKMLMPGEATRITLNAFSYARQLQVVAYEYLVDAYYKDEAQSVSLQDVQKSGRQTVPNRIVRVNNPTIKLIPAGEEWKPEDVVSPGG